MSVCQAISFSSHFFCHSFEKLEWNGSYSPCDIARYIISGVRSLCVKLLPSLYSFNIFINSEVVCCVVFFFFTFHFILSKQHFFCFVWITATFIQIRILILRAFKHSSVPSMLVGFFFSTFFAPSNRIVLYGTLSISLSSLIAFSLCTWYRIDRFT